MHILLYIFFIILIYYGFLGMFVPQEQRAITWATLKAIPFKLWGIIVILIGVFLFQMAELFTFPLFIYLLSLLFFIEGSLFFFLPKKKIKELVHYWLLMPNNLIKLISLFYVLLGVVLFLLFRY